MYSDPATSGLTSNCISNSFTIHSLKRNQSNIVLVPSRAAPVALLAWRCVVRLVVPFPSLASRARRPFSRQVRRSVIPGNIRIPRKPSHLVIRRRILLHRNRTSAERCLRPQNSQRRSPYEAIWSLADAFWRNAKQSLVRSSIIRRNRSGGADRTVHSHDGEFGPRLLCRDRPTWGLLGATERSVTNHSI